MRRFLTELHLFHQQTNYNCGPASIRNLLSILGVPPSDIPSEKDLAKELNSTPEDGTFTAAIEEWLSSHDITFQRIESPSSFRASLQKGFMILVIFQAYGTTQEKDNNESGHFSIVTGEANDKEFYVIDPYTSKDEPVRKIPKSTFFKRWTVKDESGKEGISHYGLAILKPKRVDQAIEELEEQVLSEMPWIEYGTSKKQVFDLEFEKFAKNPQLFVEYLKRILRGETVFDKYGNHVQLTSKQSQLDFLRSLRGNPIFHQITLRCPDIDWSAVLGGSNK